MLLKSYRQVCEDECSPCVCNISVALGCSGLGSGVVIKIDVSHHYYVPQQRQEHGIHHSLKLRVYFHKFPQSSEHLCWNKTPLFLTNKCSSFSFD